MSEYFAVVFAVAFVATLGGSILYDGERATASRTAISVVLLLAVLSPLPALISDLPVLQEPIIPDGIEGTEEYIRVAEEAFKDGISEMLAQKYSLPEEDFAVKLENFDFATMSAERISVTLRAGAVVCDPLAVERYINSYGIGECHAEIGI